MEVEMEKAKEEAEKTCALAEKETRETVAQLESAKLLAEELEGKV